MTIINTLKNIVCGRMPPGSGWVTPKKSSREMFFRKLHPMTGQPKGPVFFGHHFSKVMTFREIPSQRTRLPRKPFPQQFGLSTYTYMTSLPLYTHSVFWSLRIDWPNKSDWSYFESHFQVTLQIKSVSIKEAWLTTEAWMVIFQTSFSGYPLKDTRQTLVTEEWLVISRIPWKELSRKNVFQEDISWEELFCCRHV